MYGAPLNAFVHSIIRKEIMFLIWTTPYVYKFLTVSKMYGPYLEVVTTQMNLEFLWTDHKIYPNYTSAELDVHN
jgi:hypothetical protein